MKINLFEFYSILSNVVYWLLYYLMYSIDWSITVSEEVDDAGGRATTNFGDLGGLHFLSKAFGGIA